jgi:hypothetical protein
VRTVQLAQIKISYLVKFLMCFPYVDLSEEEIGSRLSYLLDLKKTGQKEPPKRSNVPTSLISASVDQANQPIVSAAQIM